MVAKECLTPAAAMGLHTFACMVYFVGTRFAVIQSKAVHPKFWRTGDAKYGAQPEWAVQASNHVKNLFETPVIFYAMCIAGSVLGLGDATFLGTSWLYVGARVVHSLIHLSYNEPAHRLTAFLVSILALVFLTLRVLWATL